MIEHLPKLIERARKSPRWLLILNLLLSRVIPFNRPHGFRIAAITEEMVRSAATYRQVNRNHVRGIHACAIATVAEMSAGFLLLSRLDPQRYRLIMGRLEVDYHYQAKEGITSESFLPSHRLINEIIGPLREQDAITVCMESLVTDQSGNRIAEGRTTWQIKRWDRVRTKL